MLRLAVPPLGVFRPVYVLAIASFALSGVWPGHAARAQENPVASPAAAEGLFPGYTAAPAPEVFPGIPPGSIGRTPLSGSPAVLGLERRPAGRMLAEDASMVASASTELREKARISGFDIGSGKWEYEQIVAPAFPDFIFLAFRQGSDASAPSRFVAVLERNTQWLRVVPTVSKPTAPLGWPWSRPGAYEIFNYMLRRERGLRPLGSAPAWLSIAMSYAEFSGHDVQVFVPEPLPDSTLDLSRLGANRPELHINPDQSADVTFSDASKPAITTDWLLRFDRHGQIFSVSRSGERQPTKAALRP